MNTLNFKEVADSALGHIDGLLAEWLPSGKYDHHEYVALNPTRADKNLGSFRVNVRTGEWSDFATGDKGGDLVSLYAYLFCSNKQGEALKALAERLRIGNFFIPNKQVIESMQHANKKHQWKPILPVPEYALSGMVRDYSFKGKGNQSPERVAIYRNTEGQVLGAVLRFRNSEGGKDDIPRTFCTNEQGVMQWRWRGFENPWPLYGLDVLAKNPTKPVLLVEGEKCKDVGSSFVGLNDFVVMSWGGGCNGWKKTDWSPLAGREVVLWPDCDSQRVKLSAADKQHGLSELDMPYLHRDEQPGMKAMLGIGQKLAELGCQLRMVAIAEPGELPSGYDIADAIADKSVDVIQMVHQAYPLQFNQTNSSLQSNNNKCERNLMRPQSEGAFVGADKENNEVESSLLSELLNNYAQVGQKERIINLKTGETFSRRQLDKVFTKLTVTTWLNLASRQQIPEFQADIIAKQKKLEILASYNKNFANSLERYIYLDGTTDAFDIQLDCIVPLAAVKAAIPDQFDDWSKSPERKVCPMSNYVFEPDLPVGISYDETGGKVNYINMFRGLPVQASNYSHSVPLATTLAELKLQYPGCKNIIGLVEHLCSGNGDRSEAVAEWVLNWLACRFRWPQRKPATALVFISETQGVGKSTFGERVIKGLFGDYLRQLDQNALESRFNAVLLFALVTIFEEISPSDERMNIIGKLKNMITSDIIMVERKGRDAEKHSDYNSFVIFSNDERSIPIESNDRRFMISSCNRKFTDEQYQALDAELQNGGIEEFAAFLCALPLMYTTDEGKRMAFSPHAKPIMTPVKRRMINLNKQSWEAFLDDWWSGELKVPFITCAAADLWAVYKHWCTDTKTYPMIQKNFYANIGKRLQDLKTRIKIDGIEKRIRIFVVPHAWLSDTHKNRYPQPNTDHVERGSAGAINRADYYGSQVKDFNNIAGLSTL